MSIRNEAIITELLFQHALRIRVKSETAMDGGDDIKDASNGSAEQTAGEKTKNNFLVGRLNNLITSDLANITEGNKQALILCQSPRFIRLRCILMMLWHCKWWKPRYRWASQLRLCIAFGMEVRFKCITSCMTVTQRANTHPSAIVGLVTLVVLLPIPGYLSSWIQAFQKKMMDKVRLAATCLSSYPAHPNGREDRRTGAANQRRYT